MNLNLLDALDQLEAEKGISKEEVITILESALQSAYKKNFGAESPVEVKIDRLTGDIELFERMRVVDKVDDPLTEVDLNEALDTDNTAAVGKEIVRKINIKKFKRIAAQTARQVLIQKIRELEKENLYDRYSDLKGKITTAEVIRATDDFADLRVGKIETRISSKELIPGERIRSNQLLKVYVADLVKSPKGPRLLVTRRTTDFVAQLLKLQVPEIESGEVLIKSIAREEGVRTKVALEAQQERIDPVGACIGESGIRISEVLREIQPEKVDLLRWSADPAVLISNSIAPASAVDVKITDSEKKEAIVYVSPNQLSLAIGRGGQNARLAARLTGWKIDIKPVI
ncbi:MAG TPA: transcription termination/antitermination protein NusA [Kosmotogaceae bacterium]|nr:MAG: NusA antitermination factor [Thermotogales bacterium 46_20]HAA86511.1 transcription termination/antitermination protein NusA [Kosmotogaceae bacterium]